ncbi:hyaluronidase-3 isoform X2 [Pontoporia blainvillei]|uniref:Hyaluronidase n=1 Tax=Pontoporia blainvillei TaxID=48723 RepID=A0ABX0S5W4_PONBL|nr:hyaluronidase-3 isoform X2 [Pontoporia blainvillei]
MAKGSRDPVVPNRPFATIWNANTQWCLERHGVDVDVSVFDVVANPGQTFRGPDMTIFYSSQLGTYPYYTPAGEPVFGGLPQNASLAVHLVRAFQDIQAAMPASNFSGLAVIDWEAWRPRWAFNWDTKDIYRQRSRALVQGQHPDWPAPWVEAAAQDQFEGAARAWMAGTLRLGQALQPRGLWGFYGFPDCYNYDFKNPNYTGQCPPDIRAQNDQLGWLWGQSRALYPSIYLPAALEGTRKAQLFVQHRVGEAFRLAVGAGYPDLPVLPYVQIFYDMTNRFLPLESCQAIKEYVDTTLGPFILNVTSGALLCSQVLCSGHGRCARRPSHPEARLILSPTSFSIESMPGGGPLTLRGPPGIGDGILQVTCAIRQADSYPRPYTPGGADPEYHSSLTLDPACQPEVTLRSNLAKLILDPTHQPDLTLSPRLAELTLGSACHPEMTLSPGSTELTLDPARQPEETPAPNLAELTLEPVHCRPELLDACADLINEQWPRSRASRLHSLGQSSDAFPLCLMLLSPRPTPEADPIVVGHARLSRVLDRPQSLLVETVVVARALRGRGFGRCLMEGLEAFAQARGFRRLHLTTHDQLHFYAHLGYQLGFHPCGMTMQLGLALVLGVALCLGCGQPLLQAPERPFLVLWNVPSAHCKARFGVHLPLEALGIVANRGQRFHGQNVTIFYKNQLGFYPYLGPRGTAHNGGIPQAVPLDRHLAWAAYQIRHSLQPGFAGLAVLDWEEWCPLWSGNWGRRQVYQTASWAWARRVFPNLDPQEQLYKARIGFEQAARALMEDTLQLGRALQPHGLWGFYRFPACGNGWHGTASNYTGHCHAATLARNTQLHWLWAASSALFPSIYLPPRLPPAHHHAFVRYRLEEAFRVALAGHPHPLPVLAYARLTHRNSGRFLSQEECWHLHDYLVSTLGPYVINVTRAAMACSHQRCHGHGRCAWQDPGQLEVFLHLEPDGSPGDWESFSCRCYWGWAGPTCQEPRPEEAT